MSQRHFVLADAQLVMLERDFPWRVSATFRDVGVSLSAADASADNVASSGNIR